MKEIPGFDGYFANKDGFVYSFKSGSCKKLAVYHKKSHPYLMVSLQRDGRSVSQKVHTLVLQAFSGPKPIGYEARHLDGDCLNNKPNNLKWGSRQQNVNDKKRHGTIIVGELNGRSKLTSEQVAEIRSLAGSLSTYALAKKYGVGQTTISAIHTGRSWVGGLIS